MIVARLVTLVMLLTVAFSAQAQTASVSLSEESAQLRYGMLVGAQNMGRNEMNVGFLFNEDDDYVAELGLLVVDEAGSRAPGLKAGVGGKLYVATLPDDDIAAIGVGGLLRYTFSKYDRVTLGADAFYAPPIVSFMDAKNFRELAARLEFAVLPQASTFIEYQEYHTSTDGGGSDSIDKGARLGLYVEF